MNTLKEQNKWSTLHILVFLFYIYNGSIWFFVQFLHKILRIKVSLHNIRYKHPRKESCLSSYQYTPTPFGNENYSYHPSTHNIRWMRNINSKPLYQQSKLVTDISQMLYPLHLVSPIVVEQLTEKRHMIRLLNHDVSMHDNYTQRLHTALELCIWTSLAWWWAWSLALSSRCCSDSSMLHSPSVKPPYVSLGLWSESLTRSVVEATIKLCFGGWNLLCNATHQTHRLGRTLLQRTAAVHQEVPLWGIGIQEQWWRATHLVECGRATDGRTHTSSLRHHRGRGTRSYTWRPEIHIS